MASLSQAIRQKYELGEVMHMTDIQNLESIFSEGSLLAKNIIIQNQKSFKDISNPSVQVGRANVIIECTGKSLHDYVPLYWGRKTPMVSALREQNESLIFLMFSTNLLAENPSVICDGNARTAGTKFCEYRQISDLEILDPKAINSTKYAHDNETKRRKQAEVLVLDRLPLKHLLYVICPSEMVKEKVLALAATQGINCRVYVGAGNYYFLGKK